MAYGDYYKDGLRIETVDEVKSAKVKEIADVPIRPRD